MIPTDSNTARDTLSRIESANGEWTAYGYDGRLTTDAVDAVRQWPAGRGFRARFVDGPHGGDYGWGPLGRTEAEAVALMLAEYVAAQDGETEMIQEKEIAASGNLYSALCAVGDAIGKNERMMLCSIFEYAGEAGMPALRRCLEQLWSEAKANSLILHALNCLNVCDGMRRDREEA